LGNTQGREVLKKIKVGIIGAGSIGRVHIDSLRRLGFVEVVALATSREETAKTKARDLCIPKAYGDYRELIEDEEVEVVDIASPNYLHFPQAKMALEAGKHVVCEKPLGMNSEESRTLVNLAKEKKLVNALIFNIRFYPLVQQVKAMVERTQVGSINIVHGGVYQDWLFHETDYNWRVESKRGGVLRAVGDIGIHWLDTIQFVTGLRVESVFSDLATFIPWRYESEGETQASLQQKMETRSYRKKHVTTEDYAAVLLKFYKANARGLMGVSQISAGRKFKLFFEISGSKSSVAWDSEKANELWIGHRDKPNEILIKTPSLLYESSRRYISYLGGAGEGFLETHFQCSRAIYEYIWKEKYRKDIKPNFPTFEDGHRAQLICEAILESAKQKKWIKVASG